MRNSVIILAGVTVFLAACSAEPGTSEGSPQAEASSSADPHDGHHMGPSKEAAREKQEFAEALADHFDAQECRSSELIGTMRRTEPDETGLYVRSYQASAVCADELKVAIEARGFSEAEPGRYINEPDGGKTERVVIRMADDGSTAGIEWEVETK
ncbi:hypothetical protein [Erythrobacter crassostreae]|uniref:Lipoprotein n=1 Tax=Erythrobacter crassostreae TaxID=2828328 RepID=A0A9X1JLB6_9SPHN|nr:hypothetical protein [Erythrobacter crassostrea]MBV7259886.1 hypothetical protein [Erythrobacter crassostrea]